MLTLPHWACSDSPHITSIRERITAGRSGDPISADTLRKLLIDNQATIDEAVAAESGLLTHFEVSRGDHCPCIAVLICSRIYDW